MLGLAIAVVLGLGLGIAMHMVRPLRDAAYPLLMASQAIPLVVLAPLFILAFGYGIAPKLAIIALICYFPIVVNVLDGLRSVDPDLLKLMRSLGATRRMQLWKAELPASLPFLFSGLRLAAVFSVIGAVFGEWAGADRGPREARAAGQQPAPNAARLRGRGAPHAHRDRPLCFRVGLGAGGDSMEAQLMRRFAVAGCALAGAAGCGEKDDVLRPIRPARFRLMLDYFPNADHAPIYAAQSHGDFGRRGST